MATRDDGGAFTVKDLTIAVLFLLAVRSICQKISRFLWELLRIMGDQ